MEKKFSKVAISENNPKWKESICRKNELYERKDDIRSEFIRDYNRILHSNSYGRLKHKTQVFFATHNDHICTRIEHVNHVSSVSYSIANYLGLNTQLTTAIAIGHDIGHAPFGHEGEVVLSGYEFGKHTGHKAKFKFWHEKNSLRFVDKLETLPDEENDEVNLNLTYAVRDGIICHCGEVDENAIFPRNDYIDLENITAPGQYSPYTWEGCVVKIADKISYLGRDIEDAWRLNILTTSQQRELYKIAKRILKKDTIKKINNTVLMHDFMTDLCKNSSIENGIILSSKYIELMNEVKAFNYKYIYKNFRVNKFKAYVKLILETIIETLENIYDGKETLNKLKEYKEIHPLLYSSFYDWIIKYTNTYRMLTKKYKNEKIYDLENEEDYYQLIIDYISGMTDSFAIRIFNEILQL